MSTRTIRIVIDSRQAESGSDRAKRALRSVSTEADRAERDMQRLSRTLNVLKSAFYAVGGAMLVRELGRLADTAKQLSAELLIVEGSMSKVRDRQRELTDLSLRTGTALTDNVELYRKVKSALFETYGESGKYLRVTESVSKALIVSGADANTASGAIRQLGQALASGAFRGDEFNSVAEAAPRLMKMLAESLGVPTAKLREMAAEGKLTGNLIYEALSDRRFTESLDREFSLLPMTFARAAENIKTAATRVFGAFDRGGQFSNYLLNFAKFGSDDIESLANSAEDLGIEIRSILGGLGDAFDPFVDAGFLGFAKLDTRVETFVAELRTVLNILDSINPGRLDTYFNAAGKATREYLTGDPRTAGARARAEWAKGTAGVEPRAGDRFYEGYQTDRRRNAANAAIDALPTYDDIDIGGLGKALGLRTEVAAAAAATAASDSKSAAELKKAASEQANRLKAANDNLESASRELELARAVWDGDVERTRLRHELADIDKVRAGLSKAELAVLGPILDRQKEITEEIYKQARFAEIAADAKARLDPGPLHDPDKDLADLKRGYEEAGRAGGRALRDESLLAAEAFGQAIGGKVGGIIKQLAGVLQGLRSGDFTGVDGPLGGILTLFGGAKNGHSMTLGGGVLPGGGVMSALPDLTKGTFSKGMKEAFDNAAKPFKDVAREISKSFGLDGAFTQTLGKAFGGAAVGTATSGVMKSLGIKTSQTGAQIGGAIGGITGIPGGEIIGSVLGGLLGGMLKKAKTGMATITSVDGDATLSGNSNKRKQAAAGLAGSVQSGLSGIADALGAELGSFSVSIGMRDDKYRVNPAGTGKTKIKNGAVDFGSDAEGAMKFAIRDAIRDGALLGISAFSERVLKGNTDLDKALDLATKYEQVLDALGADANGITAAAKDFTESFQTLAKEMQKVGATAEELANVEKLYGIEREKAMQALLAPLLDYQKSLSGEGSGVTALERMKSAQVDYEKAKADFAAGKVDQSTVTGAGQQYFGLARDVLGTANSEFQSIRQQLISDSAGLLETARNAFNAGAPDKLVAMQETANTIATQAYQQQVIGNQYLAAIQASLAGIAGGGGGIAGLRFVNGKLMAA